MYERRDLRVEAESFCCATTIPDPVDALTVAEPGMVVDRDFSERLDWW
jgi:hypothetical protein